MKKRIAWMGDSLSHPNTMQTALHLCGPAQVEEKLRAMGVNCAVMNRAKDGSNTGNTGSNMLPRMASLTAGRTLDLCVVFGGVNDPGSSIAKAATQANIQAMLQMAKFGCDGCVADQTALPASARPGSRYTVLADSSSTGGVTAGPGQTPTVPGAGGSAVTTWEYRYGIAGEYGWGRIAFPGASGDRCTRLMVVSTQFLNYSGGDTTGTPYASYVNVRAAQVAAAAAEGAVCVDLYNAMRDLIVTGVVPDMSSVYTQARAWHVASANQHLNQFGHEIVAQTVVRSIIAQPGWVEALKAA